MNLVSEDKGQYNIFKGITLSDDQTDCIDFMLTKLNCICSAQTGIGKTCIAIASSHRIMRFYKSTVTVIVCPKANTSAYKKELARAGLSYSVRTTDEKSTMKASRYFIFNYSNLDPLIQFLDKMDSLNIKVIGVFDEVHNLGSRDSNTAKTLRNLRERFACRMCFTATPLLNSMEGLYYVVDFARPGYLGKWYEFKQKWIKTTSVKKYINGVMREFEDFVGYNDIDVLREVLSDVIISRFRTYDIEFMYRTTEMTSDEYSLYRDAAKGILTSSEKKQYSARLWDLQRVADSSGAGKTKGLSSKNKLLVQTVKEILDRGEGCIIYADMEDTYTVIEKILVAFKKELKYHNLWKITGKVEYQKRLDCEKNLKAKDIVIITKAGSASINLQAVNNIVFYDIPFAVQDVIQTIGRVTRTDTKYSKQYIWFLEVKDTIDTYKKLLMVSHVDTIRQLFGKSSTLPYYSEFDQGDLERYKDIYKNQYLWCRK